MHVQDKMAKRKGNSKLTYRMKDRESEVGLESSQQLNMQMETDYLLHYILLC